MFFDKLRTSIVGLALLVGFSKPVFSVEMRQNGAVRPLCHIKVDVI